MILVRTAKQRYNRVAVWAARVGPDGMPYWSGVELGPIGDMGFRSDLPTLHGSTRRFTMADAVLVSGLRAPVAWDWVLENAGGEYAPQA